MWCGQPSLRSHCSTGYNIVKALGSSLSCSAQGQATQGGEAVLLSMTPRLILLPDAQEPTPPRLLRAHSGCPQFPQLEAPTRAEGGG
jgi:hypothetical protein